MIAVMGVILALAVAWGVIADARAESASLARRQSTLDDYTGRVRSLLQSARPAAEGMAQVGATPGEDVTGLQERAGGWAESLEVARLQTQEPVDSPGAANANSLYGQALAIYSNAAKTYELVSAADGRLQDHLMERAAAQRDAGAALWLGATQVLDSARARVDLGPSGIGAPATPALGGAPPTQPGGAAPTQPGGGGENGGTKGERRDEASRGDGSNTDGGR
jgi:hypothetical protein